MRILMLSPHVDFWPPRGGTGVRIFNVVKELVRLGHEVDFLGLQIEPGRPAATGLDGICREVVIKPLGNRDRNWSLLQSVVDARPFPANRFWDAHSVDRVSEQLRRHAYDAVWINFIYLIEHVDAALLRGIPMVVDQHECEEWLWERLQATGHPLRRLFAAWNLRKFRAFQTRLLRRVNGLICVSEDEAAFMRIRLPSDIPVWVAPNGVDTAAFQPVRELTREPVALFIGSLNVSRNTDAVRWFVRSMWPAIRRHVPGARFLVIGSYPKDSMQRLLKAMPGVELVGPVEDVRSYYTRARVMVCPHRFGVGTRLKVLEAMASGIPVVTTSVGSRGLAVEAGRELYVEDEPAAFIDQVVRVLQKNAAVEHVRQQARALVETRYRWEVIVRDAAERLTQLVDATGSAGHPARGPAAHAGSPMGAVG